MERERWRSRATFLLSSIGFAIGFGNLWRFPYLVGENGGAVFIAFFLLVVLFIAIPLFSIELALGKATRKDPVGAYRALAPRTPWFINGYLNVLTITFILGYATVICGWVMAYAFKTVMGTFAGMTPDEVAAYFEAFRSRPVEVLAWASLFLAALVAVLVRGLNKGIERANKFLIPALFIILGILLFRALTLDNIRPGLEFYLKPEFSKFTVTGAITAIGQAFFSIGVAMAGGLVFGSYMKKEQKVISNAAIIGFADTAAACLAGLVIFPCVFAFGLDPASGPGLTFITMTNVFNEMPFGRFFGFLFYILFFLAAFTSFIGASEGIVAHIRDEWGASRTRAVYIVLALLSVFAIPSAIWSVVFDKLDLTATYTLIIGGLIMTIFVGWFWPLDKFLEEAGVESRAFRLFWVIDIKFFVPLVIVVLLLNQMGIVG